MKFGVGLFNLASTAYQPRHWVLAHQDFREYAILLEDLGYDSMWLSEHHFFYDGQCPAPLTAAASALAVTENLRVGTGIMLLALYEPHRLAHVAGDLTRRSGGRLELGVGLGFRDLEFDGRGLSKRDRLSRFLAGLDVLEAHEARGGAKVRIGGNTATPVKRAAARGHPVLFSALNSLEVCRELIAAYNGAQSPADKKSAVGVAAYRNIWVTGDPVERRAALDWVRASYVQYAGLGLSLAPQSGQGGLDFADAADESTQAVVDTTIIGGVDEAVAQLGVLEALGVEEVIFRLILDGAPRFAIESQIRHLASEVIPQFKSGNR